MAIACAEHAIRVQPHDGRPRLRGALLQGDEQPSPEPQAADGRRDPEPLDLAPCRGATADVVVAEHAAADRLVAKPRDEEEPHRRDEVGRPVRRSRDPVEAALEARGQLVEVRLQAERACGCSGSHGSTRTSDAVRRRSTSAIAPTRRSRCASPSASRIDDATASFRRSSSARSARQARSGVPCARDRRARSARRRRRPSAASACRTRAEIARVEPEARPEGADVGAVGTDLPEHARLAERPPAREERLVERADALGHDAVEPPYLGDLLVRDFSDLSQRNAAAQARDTRRCETPEPP